MARGEIHVQLSVDYADDAKVRALARFGKGARTARDLYVQMICYSKRTLSDGFVPDEQIGILAYPDSPAAGVKDAQRLAEVGLVERRGGGWHVRSFLKRNKSRDEVKRDADELSETASRGGSFGNHRRWHENRGVTDPDCVHCHPSRSGAIGGTDRGAIGGDIAPNRTESESESETETSDPDREVIASPRTPKPGSDGDPGFTAFWDAYPAKRDKGHARKAWAKAIKAGADPETVIAAAKRYREDPNRKPEFTAYPATWLNGERWNDAPDSEARPWQHGDPWPEGKEVPAWLA